jgi:superfamily I DNA and/or RNA helicase
VPVRDLLRQARHLVQAIKPCVLTSPLAASQFLPADMRFDAVIFDEASRISPADALTCIYRGGSVILAGDHRQLPPAGPASGAMDDGDQGPAEFGEADPESVLDVAKGSGAFGNLTLRWHYRSRHEELIAFPNAAFYGGRLLPVPGGGAVAGVELFHGEGTYQSRTTRDNPGEAARVAQRIVHHYSTRPGLSLGVVTFSEAQAQAIETALGEARKQHPGLDRFFATDRLRGFFVKSVAAVQGDERDVLIVSVGYGPDEKGVLSGDFGPLGRPGGWRRLNVAITRARYRVEIVSSIRASDITGEELVYLRRYLHEAQTG